ncbi:MAG: hypothetical protein MOGMAGMI_00419 [Candidatus Omnitrophica bacterium]|nr:hypothetical protein [Candidatus Omnitrophota bacterium]
MVLSVAGVAAWVNWACRALAHPYSLDYAEPVVELAVRELWAGRLPYRPIGEPPLTLFPYNPLYAGLCALVSWGREAWLPAAGRLVSSLSALIVAAAVYALARSLRAPRWAAVCGASLWLADPLALRASALFKMDMTALAWEWTALALAAAALSRTRIALAMLMILAAYLTKQTHVLAALPLVAAVAVDRGARQALVCGGVLAALAVALTLILQAATSGAYLDSVWTANLLGYHPRLALGHAAQYVRNHGVWFPAAVLGLWAAMRGPAPSGAKRALVIYIPSALFSGALAGKVGAGENYWLQMTPVLYIGAALVMGLRGNSPAIWAVLVAAVLSVSQVWTSTAGQARALADQRRTLAPVVAALERTRGEVLSEDLSLPLRAGKTVHYCPFEYTQLADLGRWDQTAFVESVRRGDYELLIFQTNVYAVRRTQRYSEAFINAVRERYRAVGATGGSILCVRKDAAAAS